VTLVEGMTDLGEARHGKRTVGAHAVSVKSEFLEDFPTVTQEQAIAALEQAKEALLVRAHSA
jgi:hypothetical protein